MQVPKEQVCPSRHCLHCSPRAPHSDDEGIETHMPLALQQPVAQVLGEQGGREGPQLVDPTAPMARPKQRAAKGTLEGFMLPHHPIRP